MTVTIKKMSAGKGYEYLLRTVSAGDGDRSLSTPLTRYYPEAGTPHGRWMGSGVTSLESHIAQGDEVTEEQIKLLIGEGKHPGKGQHLGRAYRRFKPVEDGKQRHPVAGYDFTFSIPKSASVLWAVADGGAQAIIADAHHAAVAEALDFMERGHRNPGRRQGTQGRVSLNRWSVTDVRDDGSLVVRRQGRRRGGAPVLPTDYVAEHLDLGYAITAHRGQGVTVDTAHVVVFDNATRENLYVAMTRGREHNHAYVIVNQADDNHGAPDAEGPTAKSVVLGILANSGAKLSAHQTVKTEQEAWTSIAQLAAEYETIAAAAHRDRWATLVRSCGLTSEQADAVIDGSLRTPRRRTPARRGQRPRRPAAAACSRTRHGLDDAEDIAAILRYRLALATKTTGTRRVRRPAKLIAGLIPEALGPIAPDMRAALDERRDLIEQRARRGLRRIRGLPRRAARRSGPPTRRRTPGPADGSGLRSCLPHSLMHELRRAGRPRICSQDKDPGSAVIVSEGRLP
jgi:hypothetical protein